MFATLLIVPILITGLPWTDVWGGGLSYVQERTGQSSPSRAFGGEPVLSKSHAGETLSLEAVLDVARASGADGPWEIRPPKDERGTFYVANLTEVRAVPSSASAGKGMLVLVVVLALLLPLMGASLALALLLDRFVFRRIGWFRTEPALVPGA